MSRIRTVKPDFWVSEQVLSCSPLARLLFIGMWNFCDDNGIHTVSYIRLKAEIFPGDSISLDEIKRLIAELINNMLLREYLVDGQLYWLVTGWKKHQRIDRPTYKYPLPLSSETKIVDSSTNDLRLLDDASMNIQQDVVDDSATERKGKERKGKDKDISEAEASSVSDVGVIFSHWQKVMDHPRAKLDSNRVDLINKALAMGYTVDELKLAIDGCSKTSFNMGKNDSNRRYDDIGLILRDAEHIDRFIENSANKSSSLNDDVMAGAI